MRSSSKNMSTKSSWPRPCSSMENSTSTADDPALNLRAIGASPITIHFTVECPQAQEWELLFVSGSHAKLGDWCVKNALEMVKTCLKDSTSKKWHACIEVDPAECRRLLRFRYFIGYYLQDSLGTRPTLLVSSWESQHRTRCLLPYVEAYNGICRVKHVDTFGRYGEKYQVTDGWLNAAAANQQAILLRLQGDALQFYKTRHAERDVYVKVAPFDVRHREISSADEDLDDSSQDGSSTLPLFPSFSTTEFTNLLDDENCEFREQLPQGQLFRNNEDFFVFKTHSVSVENMAFRIELFTPRTNHSVQNTVVSESRLSMDNNFASSMTSLMGRSSPGTPNGFGGMDRFAIVYCMPASIPDTYGKVLLPILSKTQQPIGQLKVGYLFVNALPTPQTIEVTYARHWKKRRQPVEVGHRGMGNSYTKFSAVRENTVESMNYAARNGADFVEFDVQLSKDKVPVIFHDFHVLVSVAARRPSSTESKKDSRHLSPASATSSRNKSSGSQKGSKTEPEIGSCSKFNGIKSSPGQDLQSSSNSTSKESQIKRKTSNQGQNGVQNSVLNKISSTSSISGISAGTRWRAARKKPPPGTSGAMAAITDENAALSSDEFQEMAVKDLLLRQLRLLHMHHRAAINGAARKNSHALTIPHEAHTRRPFPSLVEALKNVNMDIGFNIEVKYPMRLVDGTIECENYFERNEYVDHILESVLAHGGPRRIVFSSFEPDVCAMIALKQIKYPVLFLCIGKTKRYVDYDDVRSSSSRVAVNFAAGFNLLGVNFHSEDLLFETSQVARAHDKGLVSFVWGEDLEQHENIEFFRKKILVDGIIYDGIGEREPRQNIFVVEREAKHALFDGRRAPSPSPSRTSSFDTLKDAMLATTAATAARDAPRVRCHVVMRH